MKTNLFILLILCLSINIFAQKNSVKKKVKPTGAKKTKIINNKTSSIKDNNLTVQSETVPATRFSGTFIQFTDDTQKLNADGWNKFLQNIYQEAQIDTIIIQRLGYRDKDISPRTYIKLKTGIIDPNNPQYKADIAISADDATESILRFADATQKTTRPMKVFVGLWMEQGEGIWEYNTPLAKNPQELETYLTEVARKNNKIANLASALYGKHPSFQGWYIPHEYWNFPFDDGSTQQQVKSQKLDKLRMFLSQVSANCKTLNTRDGKERLIGISPYFNPWLYAPFAGPTKTQANYTQILTDSGVDIVMLQDGVGARCLGSEPLDSQKIEDHRKDIKEREIYEYFQAFSDAVESAKAKNPKMEMWADLELFAKTQNGCTGEQPLAKIPFKPTDIERLKWQLTAAVESGAFTKIVGFDMYHYMNAITPDGFGTAGTLNQRLVLYNDYKKNFIHKPE